MKKTILIGIAGGTGSGKTSVANAILAEFSPSEVVLIQQDSYYHDLKHLHIDERAAVNFDHPDAVDFNEMGNDLQSLIAGQTVQIPIYDFNTHTRTDETLSVGNHHIIVLEGILALFDEKIRNMMDIKLYVDTPDDIRIIRRIKRDINKRSRTFESVIEQYYSTVRPMHQQFVEPSKKYADVIIPEGAHNKVAIDIIRTKIVSILLERNQ
ncbi:MAG: uridine kinase [Candidatus Marinimicrobia bacterium]|jgi:uridine kinase|nr:uridine kinase [Candidatus Neomarinimicrobiota bacterium]MBT5956557.1 uridine kinase [Candidatus Neomarinimicrobiota bacterium]MBT6871180.1 uridine kinase [Candidatus Neomarinimicrobiota bacterium]MBT7377736.1 uridine kinase [Candidatus Neomarinimicrobiota bacterium]